MSFDLGLFDTFYCLDYFQLTGIPVEASVYIFKPLCTNGFFLLVQFNVLEGPFV